MNTSVVLNNGLFFFQRALFNLYAHAVAVMRLHLSKMINPLLIFTFLKIFPTTHFSLFEIITNVCNK